MRGETDLDKLISTMEPSLNEGKYVFVTVLHTEHIPRKKVICEVKEKEGITVVLSQADADQLQLTYEYIAAWITLRVHSSLEAVGLTAAFATALATKGISCNVMAGYYHDHIFVGWEKREAALQALQEMVQVAT